MIRKILFILFGSMVSLLMLTSCKSNYANEMFEMYQNEPDRMISPNADIIPLGQYGDCNVACFHERHEEGLDSYIKGYSIGDYFIRTPCIMTWICVYNRKAKKLLHIGDAYNEGWINDDALIHIFYEFDQASERFTGENWHKSENFIWDLDRYKGKD